MDLGDGSWHASPYNTNAHPYNYSDMTGFNVRVVNPSLKPLKGYWMVVNDSGNAGQLWNKVSWNADAALTNGCSIEVYVRSSDERNGLGSEVFVPATNNVFFPSIRGWFIEVRLGMTRDDPSKQPLLYDLSFCRGMDLPFWAARCSTERLRSETMKSSANSWRASAESA